MSATAVRSPTEYESQLQRYLSDTDQTAVLSVYGRHNPREALQVLGVPAWADRTNSGVPSDYFR